MEHKERRILEKLNICFKDKTAKDVFLPLRTHLLKAYPAMNSFLCLILILFSHRTRMATDDYCKTLFLGSGG